MIDNPNPNNFYSAEDMELRQNTIPESKKRIVNMLEDLKNKIESEEPFPEANQSVDSLGDIHDEVEEILNRWYY